MHNKKYFHKKRVFVSGSSEGIGLAIARKYYEFGSYVIINGRNLSKLKKIKKEMPNCYVARGDITQIKVAKKISAEVNKVFGGIDILICNVGSGKSVAPGKENNKEFQKMFNLNFYSATNLIENFKMTLSKHKGSIVCISSICGIESVEGAPITYSVAKAALNSYVNFVSKPFAKLKIRINCITPGNILFDGSTWDKKIKSNKLKTLKVIKDNVPLNQFGKTDEIASLVLYLTSDVATFITGSNWSIDGGQTKSL